MAGRVDHFFSAIDEIHDSLGQAGFFQKLESAVHGKGNALGGLQYECVSAGDGVREKPVRNHRREVEGHDGGDDPERLADLHFVRAGRYVLEIVALHHHGATASDFDVLHGATKCGTGLGEGLPVFEGYDAAEIVKIFFEEIFQLEEVLDALAGSGAAPSRE